MISLARDRKKCTTFKLLNILADGSFHIYLWLVHTLTLEICGEKACMLLFWKSLFSYFRFSRVDVLEEENILEKKINVLRCRRRSLRTIGRLSQKKISSKDEQDCQHSWRRARQTLRSGGSWPLLISHWKLPRMQLSILIIVLKGKRIVFDFLHYTYTVMSI